MLRKLISVFFAVSFFLFLFSGCNNNESLRRSDEKYTIGFSQCTLSSPFYTIMKESAESYAQEKGVNLVFLCANDDVVKQNFDVQDMITAGIDALIINTINSGGCATCLQLAADAGIPIVTIDRFTDDKNVTVRVVRDNEYMGRIVGEQLLRELGKDGSGIILEIQGTAGDSVMMERRDGFEKVFEGTDYKIVRSVNCNYSRALAVTAAQDLIQGNDGIVAVYGHNDDMALGALQACQEAGLTDVKVCGVDGLMDAVNEIADSNGYCATAINDPKSILEIAMDTCIDILDGKQTDKIIDAGTDLITSENATEYLGESAFAEK